MSADSEPLLPLALSLSDGAEIDWAEVEQAADDPRQRRLVESLKSVAALSALHASYQAGAGSPATAAEERPRRWGALELIETIGRGSFGTVWRARDPRLDRIVALKLQPLDGLMAGRSTTPDQAIEEARLMARVHHPHVVSVFGADARDGQIGIWMEYLPGQTLAAWVREIGPLSPREVVTIGSELCAALAAIHGGGLLHRDVKAQNVIRTDGGRIVLMDLGAGVEPRAAGGLDNLMTTTGTPLYMAPELLQGAPASSGSDLYALGVLLFHLLTRRFPHEAAGLAELRRARLEDPPLRLRDLRPDLPLPLIDVIERALDPAPSRRWPSAGALEAALAASVRSAASGTNPDALRDEPQGEPRRGLRFSLSFGSFRLTLVASAALVAALLAGPPLWRGGPEFAPHESGSVHALKGTAAPQPVPTGALFTVRRDRSLLRYGATERFWLHVAQRSDRGAWSPLHSPRGASDAAFELVLPLDQPLGPGEVVVIATASRWAEWPATALDAERWRTLLAIAEADPARFRIVRLAAAESSR